MKKKLCRPILIETKDKSCYGDLVIDGTRKLGIHISEVEPSFHNKQQLILISLDENEKIEIGTQYLDVWNNEIIIMDKATANMLDAGMLHNPHVKVIATQEQLSPEYIQQFIEEYNKGEVKDVEIEMEDNWYIHYPSGKYHADEPTRMKKYLNEGDNYLKLTNGFVVITFKEKSKDDSDREIIELVFGKIKEPITYTEEEVKRLTNEAFLIGVKDLGTDWLNEWFELNKKK